MIKCIIKDHLNPGPLEAEKLSDENHVSGTFLPRRFDRLLEHAINYQRCWCLLYFCCMYICMKANRSSLKVAVVHSYRCGCDVLGSSKCFVKSVNVAFAYIFLSFFFQ